MKNNKSIIFDMDGVLIDSEPVMRKAGILALREYGIDPKDEDFIPFTGCGEDRFVGGVAQLHGLEYKTQMKLRAYEIYVEIVEDEAERFEKIPETLTALHNKGYKIAVASAADRIKVMANIKAAKIPIEIIEAVITGEDAKRKKPAPDAFLAAAEKLGVPPVCCVVVEDAVNGVQAAKAAGMKSIGIASTFSQDELKKAGATCTAEKTMDILPLVGSLFT